MNIDQLLRFLGVVFFCFLMTSCVGRVASPTDNLSENEAVVIVIADSEVELYGLAYVNLLGSLFSYPINGKQTVMAYKKKVGDTFIVNQVATRDGRYAKIAERKLKITTKGVYYFGTIVSTSHAVSIIDKPVDSYLSIAHKKYASLIKNLQPVNFAWPDSDSIDLNDGKIDYINSMMAQRVLKLAKISGLKVGSVTLLKPYNAKCSVTDSIRIEPPNFLSFEEYFRLSLVSELVASGKFKSDADALNLKLSELKFSTGAGTGNGFWSVGVQIYVENKLIKSSDIKYPVKTDIFPILFNSEPCHQMKKVIPFFVQKVIADMITSSEMNEYLNN